MLVGHLIYIVEHCLRLSGESSVGFLFARTKTRRLTPIGKVFRDQDIDIHQQLDLARYFGPLHKHATTAIPRNGLEEVHGGSIISSLGGNNNHSFFSLVVYNDASRRPDPSTFSKLELWHSDVGSDFMESSFAQIHYVIRFRTNSNPRV